MTLRFIVLSGKALAAGLLDTSVPSGDYSRPNM